MLRSKFLITQIFNYTNFRYNFFSKTEIYYVLRITDDIAIDEVTSNDVTARDAHVLLQILSHFFVIKAKKEVATQILGF